MEIQDREAGMTKGNISVAKVDQKPIYFVIFCMIIVIVLEVVELTKDNDATCDVKPADVNVNLSTTSDTAAASTADNNPQASTESTPVAPVSVPTPFPTLPRPPAPATDDDGTVTIGNKYDENTVVIGVDGEWPPYCHHKYVPDPNAPDQAMLAPSGFIYDFIKEACVRGGLNCVFPLTGKWHQCWAGGSGDRQDNAGTGLISGQYDMCACWVMTISRMARVWFPVNEDRGWTKQSMGGFLVLNEKRNTAEWERLKMTWSNDNCDGATMKQLPNGDWVDGCSSDTPTDISECAKTCPDGKVRLGYVNGWALKPESFDWVINKWTNTQFDKSRVIWVDEHTHEGRTVTHADYNHIAQALEIGEIDMAYTFSNAISAMQTDDCNVCDDSAIWTDGSLTWHQVDLAYSAGGVSGFLKYGQSQLGEKINVGVEMVIDDKEWYCNKCIEYWTTTLDCNNSCIGCGDDAPEGGVNYCAGLI